MKLNQADTQLGIKFAVVEFEDADILALVQDATKLSRVTDAVNADRRQKIALVDARYDLSVLIDGLGFKRITKAVTVDGVTTQVPDETEGKHIKRFTDALADGTFTLEGFTPSSGDATVKLAAATAFLQTLAYKCGDKEFDGKPCYILNLEKTVRKGGTGLIPKWAMDAAATIIKNGSQATWVERFSKGYTTSRGIAIDPFVFGDFQQVAPSGSTPEAADAIVQSNVKHLAKAVAEVRRQENEKSQVEFA